MAFLRYTLLAALVLAVSACDSGSNNDTVRRGFVTQISIIDAPLFKDNGDRWDGGIIPSGPDIFLEIEGTNGVTLLSTRDITDADGSSVGVLEDAEAVDFPFTFVFPDIPDTEFDDLNRVLRVELRDADPTGSENMLFTESFTLDAFAPTSPGGSSNVRVESADGTAIVQLTVDWEN